MSQRIRIGIHPQSPAGPVLLRAPAFASVREALADDVEWVWYDHGTKTPAQFASGAIDVALTGATPPVTVQAAGADIVYLAVGQSRPRSGAIVVPTGSPVQDLRGLASGRIGFAVGSWHTAFVALALDAAGLSYRDITPVSFVDTAGRVDRTAVDAWVARPEEIDAPDVRPLVTVGDVWSNRSVTFARREVAQRAPEVLGRFIAALDAAGRWLGRHPAQAATLLEDGSPVTRDALERGIRQQLGAEGLGPADAAFAQEQQRVADVLSAAGVLGPVRIADAVDAASHAVWTHAQAHALAVA